MKHKRVKNNLENMKKIEVNFSQLSAKSQRSWSIPEYYEDELIHCEQCSEAFLFTAQEQQRWYEIKQRYFWMRPKLCQKHFDEWLHRKSTKINMDKSFKIYAKDKSFKNSYELANSIILCYKDIKLARLDKAVELLRFCIKNDYKTKSSEKLLEEIYEIRNSRF